MLHDLIRPSLAIGMQHYLHYREPNCI
jgi:hypothetical protein